MCSNPQKSGDLVTFTEEILNGKLHFLCSPKVENSDNSGRNEHCFFHNI